MDNLYGYTDYRLWLKDWFQERKKTDSWFSFRQLGGRIEVDPGYLSHVVHGAAHLSEDHLPALAREAKLDKAQAAYLVELVRFNKAKKPKEIAERFSRLAQMRGLQATTLTERQYLFYAQWHHMAVRLALSLAPFSDDWDALSRQLVFPLDRSDLEASVELLVELGLARRQADGTMELTERFVSTGDQWKTLAVRGYQLQSLEMAARALLELPKEERDISTVSLTLPASELPLLQEKIREFRQSLLRWSAGHERCDTAYQVNLQVFPIARDARASAEDAPDAPVAEPRRRKAST